MLLRRRSFRIALVVAAVVLGGCRAKPAVDVETVAATSAPTGAPAAAAREGAPPIAPDAELPPGHPPVDGQPAQADPALPPGHSPLASSTDAMQAVAGTMVPGGQGEQAIAWTPPAGWVAEPPANQMRRAQYRVPGVRGDAECVVFYFGPGQGGDPQANAERWASQFVGPDGAPATSALATRAGESGGMKVLFVETRGTYLSGSMAGGGADRKPGYALLGAIVEGPDANWFFKLTGPEATVLAQRQAFETMIGSMKRGG
jgi:hypothetical protein